MRKKTFLVLSLRSITVLLLAGLVNLLAADQRSWLTTSGSILALVALLLQVILWYAGVYKTSQSSDWGWLVAIIFLTPLATLLYGLLGPEDRLPALAFLPPGRETASLPARREPLPPWIPSAAPGSQEASLPPAASPRSDRGNWREGPPSLES